MGFFKNIGKAVKKVNLRGVMKLANNFTSMIPVAGGLVGGLVDKGIANAEEKRAIKNANAQQHQQVVAQMLAEHAQKLQAKKASSYTEALSPLDTNLKTNPDIKDILLGMAGGAATGLGGVLAGTSTTGQVGSTVIDNSISTWFKEHWYKVLGALAVLGGVIYFATRGGSRSRRRY